MCCAQLKKTLMTRLLLFLFTIIYCSCSSKHTVPKTDLEKYGLNGRVEMIMYSDFDPININGVVEKGNETNLFLQDKILKFSPEGNLMFTYSSSNSTTEYKYDDKGNLEITFFKDSKNKLTTQHKHSYENNTLIKTDIFDENGLNTSTIYYKYDGGGNLIEEQSKGTSGISNFKREYEYERGHIAKQVDYDDANKPQFIRMFKYENGSLISSIFFTPDSTSHLVYSYDSKGNETKIQDLSRKDNDYNMLSLNITPSYREKIFNYKYDSNGNWTEQIEATDGVVTKIHSRTISYYK